MEGGELGCKVMMIWRREYMNEEAAFSGSIDSFLKAVTTVSDLLTIGTEHANNVSTGKICIELNGM
jgi:hypothetical protein